MQLYAVHLKEKKPNHSYHENLTVLAMDSVLAAVIIQLIVGTRRTLQKFWLFIDLVQKVLGLTQKSFYEYCRVVQNGSSYSMSGQGSFRSPVQSRHQTLW